MAWFWKVTAGVDGNGCIPEKLDDEVELNRLGADLFVVKRGLIKLG